MDPSYRLTWVLPSGERREAAAYRPLNLLGHAELEEMTLPQACGGQAECGTCRVRLVHGEVTAIGPDERELRERFPGRFADDERLACRARPRSDLVVALRGRRAPDLRDDEP